ncbi:hypothetical protein ONJ17_27210, partial [Salmonella enterica subsp. enterica serovar Agona]|nr:hypothetical protein [Salmonella enterica subsp. enterica serovar Agona]
GLFAHKMLIQAEGEKQSAPDAQHQALWHYDNAPSSRQPQTLTLCARCGPSRICGGFAKT